MTQIEKYTDIAQKYKKLCDDAFADLSSRLNLSCSILDSLNIYRLNLERDVTLHGKEKTLKISLEPNSARPVNFSLDKSYTSLNSVNREPELYEALCRIWIRHKDDIIKEISNQISKEIKEKESYLANKMD